MHRKNRRQVITWLFLILVLAVTGACSSGAAGQPANAVEAYLQAIVDRDENAAINLTCGEWEAQARQEFNSFSAVTLEMQDLVCEQTGQDGSAALVACTGKLIANYGAEDVEIDVAGQTYRVLEEGGEWRVCGYQQR